MNGRFLRASINETVVGTLQEVAGLWSFQYAPNWLTNPRRFALSPHLPLTADSLLDGATKRPVQWYFDNLLPEEGQRVLLAGDARLDAADAFGLLAWYGAESAGSVTLLPPDAGPQTVEPLRPLPDAALETRIRQLSKAPLTHAAIKRMSLAGAQHKLAVVFQDDGLFEPAGATPSIHILKPDHPDGDYPHSVINEWFVMRLARRLGLDVPGVYRRYVPSPVYLIDRFDRIPGDHGWQRRHVIDACQLLGLDRSFKYGQARASTVACCWRRVHRWVWPEARPGACSKTCAAVLCRRRKRCTPKSKLKMHGSPTRARSYPPRWRVNPAVSGRFCTPSSKR